MLVLKRDAGTSQPILYGRGRDLEEIETALQFDKETGTWLILGEAWEVADTTEQRAIQEVLGRSTDPMTPTEICAMLGQSRQAVQNKLTRMYTDGKVEKVSAGRYTLVSRVSQVSPVASPIETRETKDTSLHTRTRTPPAEPERDYLADWGSKTECGS